VKYRELRSLAREAGFRPVRQRGSHETWKNPKRPGRRATIAGHDRDDVPPKTLKQTLKDLGLR
jgi:predicted RNA binding protein YcfA (HicA-like mRNA interferase family)